MRTADFDYTLPQELIAQSPVEPRDSSRLLALHRDKDHIEHRRFSDIVDYLKAGDVMVLNNTRVIPGRLYGRREHTGGKVEVLLLRRIGDEVWEALVKPGRRLKDGDKVLFTDPGYTRQSSTLEGQVLGRTHSGSRLISLSYGHISELGQMPLPPYIRTPLSDPERYQTVYSSVEGSAAAPTAGLHFTEDLLNRIRDMGVNIAYVTLHIGLDTFRPVKEEDPRAHTIHKEVYDISSEAAEAITNARKSGNRIVVVGTSAARTLEQAALDQGIGHNPDKYPFDSRDEVTSPQDRPLSPHQGWASLLILPGYRFRLVDVMVTNFHLPRSTLLMMVSAFAGREQALHAYEEAIRQSYRFYSFGDAMIIL